MNDFIVAGFIKDILNRCIDRGIDKNQIPQVMLRMLIKVNDDGNLDEAFEREVQDCDIDLHEDVKCHKIEILENTLKEMIAYNDNELKIIIHKYQGVGYSPLEATERAMNTEYMRQLATIARVLDIMVNESRRQLQ